MSLAEHNPDYRLWVNDERTVLVRLWADGTVEVATRETPAHLWGPPVYLTEERIGSVNCRETLNRVRRIAQTEPDPETAVVLILAALEAGR